MDYRSNWRNYRRTTYRTVTGTITRIQPLTGNRGDECSQFVTIEDREGGITDFIVNSATYIADFVTLYQGMQAHFVYNADLPAIMIYPPQFTAVAVVSTVSAVNVTAGYFNNRFVNDDNTLQLHITESVPIVTGNNQVFYGSPGGHYLLVMYDRTTRSIPAQTTPEKIVVMCGW